MKVQARSFFVSILILFCVTRLSAEEAKPLASMPAVRVLVVENLKKVDLSIQGAYRLRLLPSGRVVRSGDSLSWTTIVPTPTGIKIGDQEWPTRGMRAETDAERGIFINQSRFRGAVDLLKNATGSLYAINKIEVEDYLYGVLHHEVSPWWPLEALKAQAVAARTYALYQAGANQAAEYDLKSGTSSQVYGGSATERYRTKKAVDATRGEILTYRGKIFPAYFHATCAGVTAGANELWKIDLPPLRGGARCSYCQISPHYFWKARISFSEIEEKFAKNGRPVGRVLNVKAITQTPSGRVGSLKITGTQGEAVIAAKDFRVWVGGDRMRSTRFKVKSGDDAAVFRGRGWGHGVGLCQWGSFGQALVGKKFLEILKFYYPRSELKQNYGSG